MLNIKRTKLILAVILCLLVTIINSADFHNPSRGNRRPAISADRVHIHYGIDSSVTILTKKEDVSQMVDLYNRMEIGPISRQMNPSDFYTVYYFQDEENVAFLNIYNKGLTKTGFKELYDEYGDVKAYALARKMYYRLKDEELPRARIKS